MKNTREIPKSSDGLFENNPKIFVLPLFSSNSLEGKRQITESPAGTVGIHSLVHRSLSDPFVPTHSRRRKCLILRRLLIPFCSHFPQQRSSVGVKSLHRANFQCPSTPSQYPVASR